MVEDERTKERGAYLPLYMHKDSAPILEAADHHPFNDSPSLVGLGSGQPVPEPN